MRAPRRAALLEALEREQAPPSATTMPLRACRKGREPRGSACFAGAPSAAAREDPEGADRLRHAAREREVDLAEAQELRAVDQPEVAGRARAAEAIGRALQAEVERDLAGRVVRDRARVVMVRPVRQVELVLRDLVDLVLGLDVAVLGDAREDADPLTVVARELEPGVLHGLVRAVHRDRARARAAPQILLRLVAQRVVVAHARERLPDVPDLVRLHAGPPGEQVRAELGSSCRSARRGRRR